MTFPPVIGWNEWVPNITALEAYLPWKTWFNRCLQVRPGKSLHCLFYELGKFGLLKRVLYSIPLPVWIGRTSDRHTLRLLPTTSCNPGGENRDRIWLTIGSFGFDCRTDRLPFNCTTRQNFALTRLNHYAPARMSEPEPKSAHTSWRERSRNQ